MPEKNSRRQFIVGSTLFISSISGCVGGQYDEEELREFRQDDTEDLEDECIIEDEVMVNYTGTIQPSEEVSESFYVDDLSDINISVSNLQDQNLQVELQRVDGHTQIIGEGSEVNTTETISEGGGLEISVYNTGEKSDFVEETVYEGEENLRAGMYIEIWVLTLDKADIKYSINRVSGDGRAILRIESEDRERLEDVSVAGEVNSRFNAPEAGRYYFRIENIGDFGQSGEWEYHFDVIGDIALPATTTVNVKTQNEDEC